MRFSPPQTAWTTDPESYAGIATECSSSAFMRPRPGGVVRCLQHSPKRIDVILEVKFPEIAAHMTILVGRRLASVASAVAHLAMTLEKESRLV